MKYLVDTCVISDFIKGEANTSNKIKDIPPNLIAISTISIMEIQYGIALTPRHRQVVEPVFMEILTSITTLNFNQGDALQAAKIRALLKQEGKPIGSYDFLLAGTAINNQLIFVTSNTKEFSRVPGLFLENWRT